MPSGGSLSVRTRRDGDGRHAVLEVSDTGTGITAADLPHVFEPFFSRKPRGKGTGLGLASVYGIVKQSHGEISIDSELGRGTTFTIRWPRQHNSLPPPPRSERPPVRASACVLLVDDDDAVRAVAEQHLLAGGYRVLCASSGAQALALLARHPEIALLISDVSMPGMSGIELAVAARSRRPELPILLISGYSDQLQRDIPPSLAVRFLPKPFSRERLQSEAHACLEAACVELEPDPRAG
jgi:CheY-like chemotaxis protein